MMENMMWRHLKLLNPVMCKHCCNASRHVVEHLCIAAYGQDWALAAQERFLPGEGSLQIPLN